MSWLLVRSVTTAAMLSLVVLSQTRAQEVKAPAVAATVNGAAISTAQLERELALVVKDRQLTPAQREAIQKEVLAHAIDRRLVLQWLAQSNQAASEQDVDLVQARLLKKLEAESIKLPDYLQAQGQTAAEFREQQRWELTWQRYLDRYLTAANLQKFFEKNRREYDGSELHVAHILLAAPKNADEAAWQELREQAADLRQQISEKKLPFTDAAKQFSKSPTATKGGDIGWIKRREPMPESFSAAAYQLQVGEVSPPVETTFGVHLITCLEVKPGTRTWQEAVDELRPAVIHYLFRWIADKERTTAKIDYTNNWPH
ncbi:Foldase protein PrsA precursor [Anatilimnocola aggregata]|uniref:Foldase protein PrsA n=1 Tax=Anatilimnocola aggregata TaxID=2528021 RepID=A0A517Y983_9BACT|nr:peptidylprolyl isomerase [Anatilimnocola aggregata]QDU26786.1 Foldase protein PrsA precursor [Anatilimnocola aggregata]